MWLQELDELVRKLAQRIQEDRGLLARESSTRYALIDPLLTALGWDLSDPHQVRTEYPSGEPESQHFLDYAMFDGERTVLVVEAKSLSKGLPDQHARFQAMSYAWDEGCHFFVVTNGDEWEGYDIREGKEKRRLFHFSVTNPKFRHIMELLWLWPGNFRSGLPRSPNIMKPDENQRAPAISAKPRTPSGPTLANFKVPKDHKVPERLVFPGGTTKNLQKNNWRSLQREVVKWLAEGGKLADREFPLTNDKKKVILSKSEDAFNRTAAPTKVAGFFVGMNLHAVSHVRRAKEILKRCGVDPAQVQVLP